MATAPRKDDNEDPLERTELARRLRRMEWPPAPATVRERVFQRIVGANGGEPDGAPEQDPAPRPPADRN